MTWKSTSTGSLSRGAAAAAGARGDQTTDDDSDSAPASPTRQSSSSSTGRAPAAVPRAATAVDLPRRTPLSSPPSPWRPSALPVASPGPSPGLPPSSPAAAAAALPRLSPPPAAIDAGTEAAAGDPDAGGSDTTPATARWRVCAMSWSSAIPAYLDSLLSFSPSLGKITGRAVGSVGCWLRRLYFCSPPPPTD